jgi:hypothetical protein
MEKITKIRAEINKLETKQIQRINKIKSWFFEKFNKLHKPLVNMTKPRRKKTQVNKIRNAKAA